MIKETVNYLVTVSYDGSDFFGWAKQPNKITVQGEIETILSKLFSAEIKILATSRTDKGVHALEQKFTFRSELNLPVKRMFNLLQKVFIRNIRVVAVKLVSQDFHPIHNVHEKEYRYLINVGEFDLFRNNYQWQLPYSINCHDLNRILMLFQGQHNFYNYCHSREKGRKFVFVRTINSLTSWKRNNIVTIKIKAKSFLRYQVRAIVAQALSCYRGAITEAKIISSLTGKKQEKYRSKAPASGLYLWKIKYN